MPLFEENKINNADSKSKVGANKLMRDRSRAIKAERKARLNRAKDLGAGTKVIRAIKSEYVKNKSGIYDVSTSSSGVQNLEGHDSTIQDNSIDNAYDNPNGGDDLPATIDILVCNSGTGVSETITVYHQP